MSTEFNNTAKNASVIGLTALLGAVFGFGLQLLVAYYFGADNSTDAFFMAQSTSELLGKLLLGGSVASLFVPLFISAKKKQGDEVANNLALNIFHITSALFIVLIVIIAIFTPQFVNFIAPGFDQQTHELTVRILRILLPSFLFLFWVDLGTAILHSLGRFGVPAKSRLIAPTVSIIAVSALATSIGIYALALGTLIGSAVQVAWIAWSLRREGLRYRFIFSPSHPDITRLVTLLYPFVFSMLVTQGAGITYRVLVSDLSAGSLTALKFAEKITQLCTIIFITSITSVVYPRLARHFSEGDSKKLLFSLKQALRLIIFITAPLVIGVALLRVPLITTIFEHGSFTSTDTLYTSSALLFFSIGLMTNGISTLFGYATLALQKTKISVIITITSQITAILLFFALVPLMGHNGLALASSLVPLVSGALYITYIKRHVPKLSTIFIDTAYVKIALLSALLAFTVYYSLYVTSRLNLGSIAPLVQLVVPTIMGIAVYATGAYIWKIPEMTQAFQIIQSKIIKLKK